MPNRRELGYVSAGSTSTVYVSTGIYGRATGGIGSPTAVTISGVNYEYLTFNATGTLTVTTAGWFDYCAVGGGGGALSYNGASNAGGGGGAGQIRFGSVYLDANQTITIGAGGSFWNRGSTGLTEGGNTTIGATSPFTQVALGNVASDNNMQPKTFVGGGVGAGSGETTMQTGSIYNGYKGGASTSTLNGGGGGGSTAAGGAGVSTTGGAGGAGTDVSVFIGGSELRKAMGGGGGGSATGGSAATGGVAGSATTTPSNGNANSGGGGGAGFGVMTTGNGGSGICYIRWKTS